MSIKTIKLSLALLLTVLPGTLLSAELAISTPGLTDCPLYYSQERKEKIENIIKNAKKLKKERDYQISQQCEKLKKELSLNTNSEIALVENKRVQYEAISQILNDYRERVGLIYSSIVLQGKTELLSMIEPNGDRRKDCHEQAILIHEILYANKEPTPYEKLDIKTQDLLIIQHLLTGDGKKHDKAGMVIKYYDQSKIDKLNTYKKQKNINNIDDELKQLLGKSTLHNTQSKGKQYGIETPVYKGQRGYEQMIAVPSIDITLEYIKEKQIPLILKHTQITRKKDELHLHGIELLPYQYDLKEKRHLPLELSKQNQTPAIVVDLYSLYEEGEKNPTIKELDPEKYLKEAALLYSVRNNEDLSWKEEKKETKNLEDVSYIEKKEDLYGHPRDVYTGTSATFECQHIYLSTYQQQENNAGTVLGKTNGAYGSVGKEPTIAELEGLLKSMKLN